MGKGDIKTKRGKISSGSYGKKRPHSVKAKKDIVSKEKDTEKSAE